MSTVHEGQRVKLINKSVSIAGGEPTILAEGLVGRVCRVYPSGIFCCVQFRNVGCRKVRQDRLISTNESAPACERHCREGC